MENLNIGIVGGGINGVTAAIRIIDKYPKTKLTIISDKFSPETTSDAAAGLWRPFVCGNLTPIEDLLRWLEETYKFLQEMSRSEDASKMGIYPTECLDFVETSSDETNPWEYLYSSFEILDENQVQKIIKLPFKKGSKMHTFMVEGTRILSCFMSRLKDNECKFIKRKLNSLSDVFDDYDLIINCTGAYASKLCEDPEIVPYRGQIVKVKAPWIKSAYFGTDCHLIPTIDYVALGYVIQKGNWNESPDEEDSKMILEKCRKFWPSLKHAEVIGSSCGLRPFRNKIRLEKEHVKDGNGKDKILIHNYGHGGSGLCLFWGCAHDVLEIIETQISQE